MQKLIYGDMVFDVNYGVYDYNLGMCFASVFGSMTSIKALARRINRKAEDITFMRRTCTTVKNGYKIYTSKVPGSDYGHAMIYRKDTVSDGQTDESIRIDMNLYVTRPAGEPREPYLRLSEDNEVPQPILDVLYAKLNGDGNFRGLASIGLLPEWMPYLARHLIRYGCLSVPVTEKPESEKDVDHDEMFIYTVGVGDAHLCNIITGGLRQHELNICGTNEASAKLEQIHGLNDYLNEYGTILADEVQERFTPRFTPGQDEYSKYLNDYSDYAAYNAGIMLYDAQKNVIQSAANCLSDEKFTFICSMMGTGKTAMAIGTAFTANCDHHKMLNVVFCPDHLVKKWRDELDRFAPLSDVHIIDSIGELAELAPRLHDKAHRLHHQWIILAKDTAKYGYDERPAAVWSKKRKCYVCPECGKPLYVEVKDPADTSRHPRKIKHFFGPLDFAKHNNANHVCMHHKTKKYLSGDGVYKYSKGEDCNTKLWTPVTKSESEFGASGEWVKLGKAGWIERRFMHSTFEKLDAMQKAYNELPPAQKKGRTPFPAKSGYETLYRELRKVFSQGKGLPPQRAPRKYSLTKYLLKYFKHELDYVILDEMQELKGGDSIQGECFGDLAFAAQHIIGLTGTLMNGYASGLYYMLYRAKPSLLAEEGFEYGTTMPFSRAYGRIQEKYVVSENSGRTHMRKMEDKELAGASPLLFTRFLLNNAVFMDLSDIAEGLPEYEEIPVGVDMDPELQQGYANLYEQISNSFGDWGQAGRVMGQVLVSLATYPDMPYNQPPIIDRDSRETLAIPVDLPQITRRKEEAFLDIVREKVENGEKVLVYYNWVNRTDTPEKLSQLLEDCGITAAVLRTSGDGGPDARDRQEWIEEQVANGTQVLMCNPRLVETGLDLLDFTTIIWYQMGTNLFTMRQACRRSLRLNQTHDVKVYFLYYRNTIQESTLIRMADKVKAARALEGHFSEEGLNALSSDDDLETQIIKDMASGLQQHLDEQNAFAGNRIHNENRQSSVYERTAIARNTVDFRRIVPLKKKKNLVSLDQGLDLLDSICC